MRLNRGDIAALIPHAGAMCLLDGVKEWDSTRIRCVSRSHLDTGNPLRANGTLSALCGIEYAAQAMAVHAGLTGTAKAKPRTGYLASLRDIECSRDRLDDLDGDLVVEAERLAGDGLRVMYGFALWIGKEQVLKGRAAVVLDTGDTDA
jgi:predicted hotdog family 3-hydroxylacyl-ACP dehydratase